MPLQIRRGLEAERTQITPTNGLVEGELLYTTDQKKLYIGSGSVGEHQGVVITGYNDLDAKDAAADIFLDGTHSGIGFAYDDETKQITATVNLASYDGPIVADALKGSVFADDSSIFLDAIDKVLYGNVSGNVTGDVTGDVTGNVLGNLAGNVIGNVTGNVIGDVTGNVIGSLAGDVTGSVFGENSNIIVDAVGNRVFASAGFFGDLDSDDGNNQTTVTPGAISINVTSNGNLGIILRTSIGINAGGDMFRVITNHEDSDPNEFTFVRGRGTQLVPTVVTPGDGLFALRFFGRGNTDLSESASIVVSADAAGTIGDEIVPGKIEFITTNDAGVTSTKLSIDKDGIIGVAANTLVAGVGSGEVDTSSVSTYLKINVGGVDYAMPLYAINP
jgi:outer membrane lipoprotein SlyB